jgi:hypothetical protein
LFVKSRVIIIQNLVNLSGLVGTADSTFYQNILCNIGEQTCEATHRQAVYFHFMQFVSRTNNECIHLKLHTNVIAYLRSVLPVQLNRYRIHHQLHQETYKMFITRSTLKMEINPIINAKVLTLFRISACLHT